MGFLFRVSRCYACCVAPEDAYIVYICHFEACALCGKVELIKLRPLVSIPVCLKSLFSIYYHKMLRKEGKTVCHGCQGWRKWQVGICRGKRRQRDSVTLLFSGKRQLLRFGFWMPCQSPCGTGMVISYGTTKSALGDMKIGHYGIIRNSGWAFPGCLLFLVFRRWWAALLRTASANVCNLYLGPGVTCWTHNVLTIKATVRKEHPLCSHKIDTVTTSVVPGMRR